MNKCFLFAIMLFVTLPLQSQACDDTATENTEQKTTASISNNVILSEILARPAGGDEEFIELYNKNESDTDVADWSLQDGSGKKFTLTNDALGTTTIKGKNFLVIPQSVSKLYLNNDGDSATLFAPDGTQHDAATFSASEEGQSWAFINNLWQWTTSVTKGTENKLTTPSTETKKEETGTQTTTNDEDKKIKEASNDIHLNELLPDPDGSDATDEWIAITNSGNSSVNLANWQITDEKEYFTFDDMAIAPNEELVVEISESHINLNNDGDKIFLIDPFAKIMEGVEYTDATEGAAWARFETGWEWTTMPTPGEENIPASIEKTETNNDEKKDESDDEQNQEKTISITSFRSLRDGEQGIIEGVATVLPGIFGSQYFYIQDDEAGVQVYSYSKSFPALAVGDRIRVHGEKSSSRNEARIKISTLEDITVLDHNTTITPSDADQLEESQEGMLVHIHGTVVARSQSSINIDDRVAVVLKSGAAIDIDILEEGSTVNIVGIVSQYDDAYRLMPRSNDDITMEEGGLALIAPAHAQSITDSIAPPSPFKPLSPLIIGLTTIIILLGSGLGVVAFKYHREKRLQHAQMMLTPLAQTPTIFDYVKKE